MVPLGEIATIERNTIAPEAIPAGTLYVGLEHIERGGRLIGHEVIGDFTVASSKFKFGPDHILYGKLRPNLGKITTPSFGGVCSTDILPIRPGSHVDRDYLAHFLAQPRMIDHAASRATGANLPRLSPSALSSFEVPLPPLDEQRRIATILDQVGRLASRTQQAADGVDRLPASIFRQMELRGFPEVALGDIVASSQIGLVRSAAQLGDRSSFEYVRMDAISSAGRWRPTMFRRTEATPVEVDKYSVRDGDLLLNTRNTRELVGKAAVYRGPVRLYNNNLMRLRFHEGIAPEYIHGYLWSRTGRQQLEQMKSGTTSVFAVYARDLMSLRLPLPPVDVQQRFSEAVRRVEERRWELERRHVQLSKLGLTLQARAFTGEL